MKALAIDENGDLFMEQGKLQEVSGVEEIRQRFRQLLRTNKGEWFLNPEEGLDYSTFWTKTPDEEAIRMTIDEVAEQVEEIERLEDVRIDFDERERTLTVSFVAILTTGEEVELEEVFT